MPRILATVSIRIPKIFLILYDPYSSLRTTSMIDADLFIQDFVQRYPIPPG
ncbi:MAG: hypothetical protein QXO71_10885 [Candidatus Jordarchaeaceae archaeon]